jgi:ATP-binding cassette subfamily F protein 3
MIHLSEIRVLQGGRTLYDGVNLQIGTAERCGLVGPNGAGKSTLFRLLNGDLTPESGEIAKPARWTIGYFSQDVGEMRGCSVLTEVKKSSRRVEDLAQQIQVFEGRLSKLDTDPLDDDAMAKLLEDYGEAQEEFERLGGYELDHRAQEILSGLGFSPMDWGRPVESFSGGWKMRVELAKILLMNPDFLMMDEPTNHLDVESIVWLESWLKDFKGTLLLTSHDRDFMNGLVTRVLEVDNGAITSYSGNYDFYERERELRREQLLAAFKRQQEMLAKEEEFIARFAARASHAAQVNSRVKKIEKIERIVIPKERKVVRFQFNQPPRSGDDVIVFDGLGKAWEQPDGSIKRCFGGVTGVIKRLSRVAVVGVNGAGKSTLLKTIIGDVAPTEGSVRIGASVSVGYFSQYATDVLDPKMSIFQTIQEVLPQASVGTIKTLLGSFLFSDDESEKKISVLSGGERSRVMLARILARPVNLLVLDEPTNHLDMQSREILLDALQRFEGTLVIVSHDRHFQRSLANRVFEIDRGALRTYEGSYDEYLSTLVARGTSNLA